MKNVSVLFAGDVMAHDNQLKAAFDQNSGEYDFSLNFKNIRKHIDAADISVCNLETTISGGEPSGYPRFNSPEALLKAIKEAGFDCVAAANNHTYDSGNQGISKTREAAEKYGLHVAGIRKNPKEEAYTILNVNGLKTAILNFTYETGRINGSRSLNNHKMDSNSSKLVNSIGFESLEDDLNKVNKEIKAAKLQGAKLVIVYYHWGNEYDRHSTVYQKYVAWATAHMGADAIIGSHAHVMQEIGEIEVNNGRKHKTVPVFYGLGNYVWGATPMYGRETVLNNILAKLDIELNTDSGDVQIKPSYIPMYILQKADSFEPLDLSSLSVEEQQKFTKITGKSYNGVIETIRNTAENKIHPNPVKLHFDKIFRIKTGERSSVIKSFLPNGDYSAFYSEDAIVASVTQNGFVIGNSAGYVGMYAVDKDGNETAFMVCVEEAGASSFPVLVNQYNQVRDIYAPAQRVNGAKYGIPEGTSLCRPAAEAWNAMMLAARNEGIYLKFNTGFRSKKVQLLRRRDYALRYGEALSRLRYQRYGCSEHHLGIAFDVSGGQFGSKNTSTVAAIQWVQKNCAKFGFVARKIKAALANVAYIHLRYIEDSELAAYLFKNNLSLEDYLTDYETHIKRFNSFTSWKSKTVSPHDDTAKLSIRKICRIIGVDLPEEFLTVADRLVPQIILSDSVPVQRGSVFFYDKNLSREMRRCRNALRSGSVAAVAEEQIYDEQGKPMPTIIVENSLDACVKVGKYLRDKYPAKTICVTGSAGKSTTTELCYHVLSSKYNTHTCTTYNNANNRVWILELLQRLKPEHEMYVQEVGGSFIDHIAKGAQMLQPDVAIITNIGEAHLDLYKTFDNIKRDKLSLLENRRPGGIGILNIDNCHLAERVSQSKDGILTCSVENPDADYFADNVVQTSEILKLTVVEKSSGHRTDVKLNIVGKHNAYNILFAFATGRWAGMSEDEIINGLASYHAKGIRQVLENVGGYHLYVDCFSSVEMSLISSMETLSSMENPPGTKKIAVLYPLMRLGGEADIINRRVGEAVRELDIDHVIVYGAEAKLMAETMMKGSIDVKYTEDWYEMVELVQHLSRPGDVIMFKGQHMQSVSLAIDTAFGTEHYVNLLTERKEHSVSFSLPDISGVIIHDVVAVIDKCQSVKKELELPSEINGKPIVCINRDSFSGKAVEKLTLPANLTSVYEAAFLNCSQLKELNIGKNLRLIADRAFMGCSSLRKVVLPRSLTSIGECSFAGCTELEEIFIPKNVLHIGETAFENCHKLRIVAEKGSFAEQYANSHGLC